MKKPHFSKLNSQETKSKLVQIERIGGEVTVWKKNGDKRYHFKIHEYKESPGAIVLVQEFLDFNFSGQIVLFHFTFKGVSFFGEANVKIDSEEYVELELKDHLYKSERRNSFRLLTYPHKKVYLNIPFDQLPEYKESNVVMLDSGQGQTNLFFNFLTLIGKRKEDKKDRERLRFRVHDISLGGLSIEVGEIEKNFLMNFEELLKLHIEFEKIEFNIDTANIVYDMEYINPINNRRVYKLGIEFQSISKETEEILAKKINALIRNVEEKFEDFID
jgi:hypothetical protein